MIFKNLYKKNHTLRINTLTLVDIAILTLIFFGEAIVSSTYGFLQLSQSNLVAPQTLVFDDNANWLGIIKECLTLAVAFFYLWVRKFDFKQFVFRFDTKTIVRVIVYIMLAGFVASFYEYLQMWLVPEWYPQDLPQTSEHLTQNSDQSYTPSEHFSQLSVSLMLFALINGFFEELYFLGIIFAVQKKYLPYVLVFSVLVRFAFHTYQGLAGAFVIATLGVSFLLLRLKNNNLTAFMLAHSFFDIFGLGLPFYWLLFE